MQSSEKSGFLDRVEYASLKILALIKNGFINLIAFPAKWKPAQWLAFCAFIGAVTVAFLFKWRIQLFIRGNNDGMAGAVANTFNYLGDFELPLFLGFIFAAIGCVRYKKILIDVGATILASSAIAGIITIILQFVLAEDRPKDGGEMFFFKFDGHGVSGHATSSSLFLFPILMIFFKDSPKAAKTAAALLMATWALLVAWSRMRYDMHFLWNVMLGLTVGLASGYATAIASIGDNSKADRT